MVHTLTPTTLRRLVSPRLFPWRLPVASTSIASVGYHPTTRTLDVVFRNGGQYRFFSVPRETYEALVRSDSLGRFFNTRIARAFRFTRFR